MIASIVVGGITLRAWLLDHVVLAPGVLDDTQGQLMMKYLYYPTYSRLDGLVVGVGLAIVRTSGSMVLTDKPPR